MLTKKTCPAGSCFGSNSGSLACDGAPSGERPGRPRQYSVVNDVAPPELDVGAARVLFAILRKAHARNVTVDNEDGPERENHRDVA